MKIDIIQGTDSCSRKWKVRCRDAHRSLSESPPRHFQTPVHRRGDSGSEAHTVSVGKLCRLYGAPRNRGSSNCPLESLRSCRCYFPVWYHFYTRDKIWSKRNGACVEAFTAPSPAGERNVEDHVELLKLSFDCGHSRALLLRSSSPTGGHFRRRDDLLVFPLFWSTARLEWTLDVSATPKDCHCKVLNLCFTESAFADVSMDSALTESLDGQIYGYRSPEVVDVFAELF